jgi:hypothetical protein
LKACFGGPSFFLSLRSKPPMGMARRKILSAPVAAGSPRKPGSPSTRPFMSLRSEPLEIPIRWQISQLL